MEGQVRAVGPRSRVGQGSRYQLSLTDNDASKHVNKDGWRSGGGGVGEGAPGERLGVRGQP